MNRSEHAYSGRWRASCARRISRRSFRSRRRFGNADRKGKRGDQVKVITGRDRGKTGRVLAVNPAKRTITVEHAGVIKRHTRPNPSQNVKGGIVDKEGPMPISNVQ